MGRFREDSIMRPSSLGRGRILRRTLSVCPSVCPSVPLSLPSVTSRHLANYNDTHVLLRHALRAAYRTAISAAQILVIIAIMLIVLQLELANFPIRIGYVFLLIN